jgi:hypothetical protein
MAAEHQKKGTCMDPFSYYGEREREQAAFNSDMYFSLYLPAEEIHILIAPTESERKKGRLNIIVCYFL